MPVFVNPTGTVLGTTGNDTFEFTAPLNTQYPGITDILGFQGQDRLIFDVAYTEGLSFRAECWIDGSSLSFDGEVRPADHGWRLDFDHFEDLAFVGTNYDDQFWIAINPGLAAQAVDFDGGAGHDKLTINSSPLDAGFSFVVAGGAVTTDYGQFSGFEQYEIIGTRWNDIIQTGDGDDYVVAGNGNDAVSTGGGDDFITTVGTGTFDAGSGADIWQCSYSGTRADLQVDIGASVAISNGTTVANAELVQLITGSGDDTFTLTRSLAGSLDAGRGAGRDRLDADFTGEVAQQISVSATYYGSLMGQVNAMSFSEFEEVSFTGSAYDDNFEVSWISNWRLIAFDGGAGDDFLRADFQMISEFSRLVVRGDGTISSNRGQFASLERFLLLGGVGDDEFVTGAGQDTLGGGAGDDSLSGKAGDDGLFGSDGDDVLDGGTGDDRLGGDEGNDRLDGGSGIDTAVYSYAGTAVTVRLDRFTAQNTGGAGIDTLANIENVTGSFHADKLIGDALGNVLEGDQGNDVLNGLAGNDTMRGGTGDDLYYVSDAGDLVIEVAGYGHDKVNAAIDFVLSANVEDLTLASAARSGTGNALGNAIFGSGGSDTLAGLGGDDTLRGNGGRDALLGGDDADLLDGGTGKDTLTGGSGRDVFQFRDGDFGATRALADTITDFSRADKEKIQLNLVDASTTAAGDQAFAWIGNGAFTHVAGQLHYAQAGGNTYVEGDTNGDGAADFVIALTGTINLAASDFVL